MRKVLAGVAAIIAAMAAAPAAHGAVVRAVDNGWITTLEYEAGAAEANRVNATWALDPATHDYNVTIEDRGAVITTTTPLGADGGSSCTIVGLHRAVCHYLNNSIHSANFQLGTLNDTFTPQGAAEDLGIDGGPGNDRLTGGTGRNWFQPGTGTDQVVGNGGDYVTYADHTTPVSITVDGQANDGSAGENDSLTGIADYTGGTGDDTLTGSGGPDRLDGGQGTDLVSGGAGDDVLGGGYADSPDHVIGGAGHDSLSAGLGGPVDALDGEVDDVYCYGRVNDLQVDSQDVLHDCPS
jgi:Ca2+-binding RTX toxin-like protein